MGLIFAVWMGISTPLCAEIYVYRAPNGVWHFTNVPTSSKYHFYCKELKAHPPVTARNSNRFDDFITRASETSGVAFSLLKAIIRAESGFNPRAVSSRGAMGLMQIMPQTVKDLDITDPFDPMDNIMGGARYFKTMLDHYNGILHLALAAYNAGPAVVDQYNAVPPYPETRQYVKRVLTYYHSYERADSH
jgi:soluble lytic murein transglycosylase